MTLRGSASSRRETSPRTSDGQLGDWTDWFYFVALDVRDQVISGQMGWVNIVLYSQNEIFFDILTVVFRQDQSAYSLPADIQQGDVRED